LYIEQLHLQDIQGDNHDVNAKDQRSVL